MYLSLQDSSRLVTMSVLVGEVDTYHGKISIFQHVLMMITTFSVMSSPQTRHFFILALHSLHATLNTYPFVVCMISLHFINIQTMM